jgi:hypothetical protein
MEEQKAIAKIASLVKTKIDKDENAANSIFTWMNLSNFRLILFIINGIALGIQNDHMKLNTSAWALLQYYNIYANVCLYISHYNIFKHTSEDRFNWFFYVMVAYYRYTRSTLGDSVTWPNFVSHTALDRLEDLGLPAVLGLSDTSNYRMDRSTNEFTVIVAMIICPWVSSYFLPGIHRPLAKWTNYPATVWCSSVPTSLGGYDAEDMCIAFMDCTEGGPAEQPAHCGLYKATKSEFCSPYCEAAYKQCAFADCEGFRDGKGGLEWQRGIKDSRRVCGTCKDEGDILSAYKWNPEGYPKECLKLFVGNTQHIKDLFLIHSKGAVNLDWGKIMADFQNSGLYQAFITEKRGKFFADAKTYYARASFTDLCLKAPSPQLRSNAQSRRKPLLRIEPPAKSTLSLLKTPRG